MAEEGERIGPGMHIVDGELHLDARKFCEEQGFPPTKRNQNTALRAMAKIARDQGIEVEVRERGGPPI